MVDHIVGVTEFKVPLPRTAGAATFIEDSVHTGCNVFFHGCIRWEFPSSIFSPEKKDESENQSDDKQYPPQSTPELRPFYKEDDC